MSKGQVFFEIAVDARLPKEGLREKLKEAAYHKTVLVDVGNKRSEWQFPNPNTHPPQPQLATDSDRMPEFIKNECLHELLPGSEAYSAEPVLLEVGSLDYYCMPDTTIICYHKYKLLKPNGSPIRVSAVHEGNSQIQDLLVVLTYETPQV